MITIRTLAKSSWALAFVGLSILLASACGSESTTISGNALVISRIPWTAPETAHYKITHGGDDIGTGDLKIEKADAFLQLAQDFRFPDRGVTDLAVAMVDPVTLAPNTVTLVINGEKGPRNCKADYAETKVHVEQSSSEGQRTDDLEVPTKSYDTWSDLFLWRTVAYTTGYEASYPDVLSCSLGKPERLTVTLKVIGKQSVTVPAGTFETWRLEIDSGGQTQDAWYATTPDQQMIRYDNGDLLFELTSVEKSGGG